MGDNPPTNSNHENGRKRPSKNQGKHHTHPLQRGIKEFITTHLPPSLLSEHNLSLATLLESLPKRYTVYEPLLLLPANAVTTPSAWGALYNSLDEGQKQALLASIVRCFSRMGVTHVAMNAPIASTHHGGKENRIRSPVGLLPLYGDFGPPPLAEEDGEGNAQPSERELECAFWTRTVQNHGIVQIWAPLYTMFSRGNITEKARILGQGDTPFEGLDESSLRDERVQDISVVDMYAGIGYFVFPYLKKGVKRAWGWEINGWSIEGLRRGCMENGWGCKVVRVREDGELDSESIRELVGGLDDTVRVVVFHGDNRFAAGILQKMRDTIESWNRVRHVNLGLLPSSRAAWDNATKMIDMDKGGWMHVHENVDIKEIDQKSAEIVAEVKHLRTQNSASATNTVVCRHVERVKTYAPGVMHCVFDIRLSSSLKYVE